MKTKIVSYIVLSVISFSSGYAASNLLMRKTKNKISGYLHIVNDPDSKSPYMYAEWNNDISEIKKKKYVTLVTKMSH